MSDSNSTSGRLGLFGILFIVFLVLKLAEVGSVATWSWWWVTAPLWIPPAIVVAVFVLIGAFAVFAVAVGALFKYLKR
jgi:hypothetical protein